MGLGTGVFLSSLFLGSIALFIATKDRWNWKKIVLRFLASTLLIVLIGGGGIYLYTWIEDRPRLESAMWNIQLGQSQDDVKFSKGAATSSDADRWRYDLIDGGGSYIVGFKDGRVKHIFHIGERQSHPSIQGVSGYSGIPSIERKFGAPSKVTSSSNGLARTIQFSNYQVWFGVSKDGIEAIGVYDPALWEPKFTDSN